jgi:hypothetical protein
MFQNRNKYNCGNVQLGFSIVKLLILRGFLRKDLFVTHAIVACVKPCNEVSRFLFTKLSTANSLHGEKFGAAPEAGASAALSCCGARRFSQKCAHLCTAQTWRWPVGVPLGTGFLSY